MKFFVLVFILLAQVFSINLYGQIGIGTVTPESSSVLDVNSVNKGVLIPRLSVSERNAISIPATGLIVYNTDFNCLNVYDGTLWQPVECDYTSAFTITNITYNGNSPLNSRGVGFVNEPIDLNSTITVTYSSTHALPYNFSAEDELTGLKFSVSGVSGVGAGQLAILTPNTVSIADPGTITMDLIGASNVMVLEPRIDIKSISGFETTVIDVGIDTDNADGDNDPTTGTFEQIWMDRNLGAIKTPDSINDPFSYGSLYQWGRLGDGHEIIATNGDDFGESSVLGTSINRSASDTPPTDLFIRFGGIPFDWRDPQNGNLWQGVNGINNPCPSGYRVPTRNELDLALSTLGISNIQDGLNSPLKFSAPGHSGSNAVISNETTAVRFHTSTTGGTRARYVGMNTTGLIGNNSNRVHGGSVRCIKN